jgi:hypothetical protein
MVPKVKDSRVWTPVIFLLVPTISPGNAFFRPLVQLLHASKAGPQLLNEVPRPLGRSFAKDKHFIACYSHGIMCTR